MYRWYISQGRNVGVKSEEQFHLKGPREKERYILACTSRKMNKMKLYVYQF